MKVYEVEINGVVHTVQLSDEDAKERGLTPVKAKDAPAPRNKARKSTTTKKA